MPEISGLLLLILFFGFNVLRKKVQQAASKEKSPSKPQTYQPTAMPAFPEAAPPMPVRSMTIEKSRTVQKKAESEPPRTPMEGEAMDWQPEPLENLRPRSDLTLRPNSRVIPVLTKDSLIQGIVLHEILTRPKHAVGSYLSNYPPRV